MSPYRPSPLRSTPPTSLAVVALLGLAVAAAATSAQEPPTTPAQVAADQVALADRGYSLYRAYCRTCHGAAAEGDGILAEILKVPPADLTRLAARNDGEFPAVQVHQVIDGREEVRGHGSREMPIWGEAFAVAPYEGAEAGEAEAPPMDPQEVQEKIAALVAYLETIQVEE